MPANTKVPDNLWELCSDGKLKEVKKLLETGEFHPLSKDENGYTPVHAAVSYAHIALLEYLLGRCCCEGEGEAGDAEGEDSKKDGDNTTIAKKEEDDDQTTTTITAKEEKVTTTITIAKEETKKTDEDVIKDEDAIKDELDFDAWANFKGDATQTFRPKPLPPSQLMEVCGVESLDEVIHVQDADGDTPFHHFSISVGDVPERKRIELLNVLRKYGADPMRRNAENQTVFETCMEMEEEENWHWFLRTFSLPIPTFTQREEDDGQNDDCEKE